MNTRTAYPRPELVRSEWINLCGEWEFEFDFGKSGKSRGVQSKEQLDQKILVPFCPESERSGIGYRDFIPACWYRKTINVPHGKNEKVLLNFEAACHKTEVFINGVSVGKHSGSYTPFSFDITETLKEGDNSLAVYCTSDVAGDGAQASGKQSPRYHSFGCYYTRSTGIYAPVWMEVVPVTYLKNVRMDPDVDNEKLDLTLTFPAIGMKNVELTALLNGKEVGTAKAKTTLTTLKMSLPLNELSLWSLDTPTLYDLIIKTADENGTDTVNSYFGMRKIELDKRCLRINGKRVFQRLVLDQGYYKDCVYTAPDDDAFAKDILLSKRLGFNGARLHERVFERRFLYEADRLGYLVWGEYANWGFDVSNAGNLKYYLSEWIEAMKRDYNHPALIGWCPFNETWDVGGREQDNGLIRAIYECTKTFDPVRPCIDTSGNYHVVTDIYDIHDYNQDVEVYRKRYAEVTENAIFENYGRRQKYNGQPYFISEYGGIKWASQIENSTTSWGYGNSPKTVEEYVDRYVGLTDVLLKTPMVCGLCYTQLYDVEQEQNGIYYYDRSPKFTEEVMDKLAAVMKQKAAIEEE